MIANGEACLAFGVWGVLAALLFATTTAGAADAADVAGDAAGPAGRLVPKPAKINVLDANTAGAFQLTSATVILHDKYTAGLAAMLAKDIATQTGLKLKLVTDAGGAPTRIDIRMNRKGWAHKDAYSLTVGSACVRIDGAPPAGRFYGTRTLLQLLIPADANASAAGGKVPPAAIPAMTIADRPRFAWRGLMLDCSRTFQSVAYVKKTIDRMAMYKMNVLHMHLTDDQGWRLEIKKYPELTGKGAKFPAKYDEPAGHQGFYTQAQMKDLIAYAAERGVTIVPEIEMPGHCLAALACYPQLSCTGGPFEIHPFFKGPGIHKEIYCAGNDETFEFLEDVLSEVIELFPSKYIHIGGDEAKKDCWNACPKCQARIKAEGLKDAHELQSWFVKRIDKFVAGKGRRIIGWDEILQGGLADNAAVMSWRGIAGGHRGRQGGPRRRHVADEPLLLRLQLEAHRHARGRSRSTRRPG